MKNRKNWNNLLGWSVFLISAIVYIITIEPSASLWDCGEFIATSYKLQVGHPPGAPLFMIISNFFTQFAFGDVTKVAFMANLMSCIASALTILFLFWSITHLGRRLISKKWDEMSSSQFWTVMGTGLVGALAYTFTDTFWFSAVEAEVYALSSLFTALVFWAILKWEDVADEPGGNRWLILIAYLMGLSIGVHILNLLAIPALVFIWYFKKNPKISTWGLIKATLVSGVFIIILNSIVIPYTTSVGAWFDKIFNDWGFPVNRGIIVYIVLLFSGLAFGVWYTHKKRKALANTILLCISMVFIGYSSYASVLIRAEANPPMNSNDPDNPYSLLYLLNREQYGSNPILMGAPYSAPVIDYVYDTKYYVNEEGDYVATEVGKGYVYPPGFKIFFPRMWSTDKQHIEGYESWGQTKGEKKVRYGGEEFIVPTLGENMRFFFSYQLNFMYWRYFLWNFVGRQSDNQSTGEIVDGQWLSGIDFVDEMFLGPQDNLPDNMKNNKARNTYYFLPFILGLIGLIYQLNRDPKNFTVVMWLFFMVGIALVVYFNNTPGQARERDYVYAGSFYAFCIWIGFGVMAIKDWIVKLTKKDNLVAAVVAIVICSSVPIVLCAQNWDDHDRSGRMVARDIGFNYLQSTLPNSIIINYGDNDTFPLWYNQEVEEIRPDVRIMNQSYLGGGWYVDEMKWKYNESDPIPFSLPKSKYMYVNDRIPIRDVVDYRVDLKEALNIVRSESPATKLHADDGSSFDFFPQHKLSLPVNKENVLKSGTVKPEDAHLILDTIYIDIKGSSLDKPELMVLDMFAHLDWERPVYFTQPNLLRDLGLMDYLQYDGYAYRFVPIKTPFEAADNIGRVDIDYLYDKLMNVFRYGNISDPDVYVDNFSRHNFNATQIRLGFARLAMGLIERGEVDKAVEVLDRGLEEVPISQIGHINSNYQSFPYIEAYYMAGEMEKGDALLLDYAEDLTQYLYYFFTFPDSKQRLISSELIGVYRELQQLCYLSALPNNRTDIVADLAMKIEIAELFFGMTYDDEGNEVKVTPVNDRTREEFLIAIESYFVEEEEKI